MQTGQSSVRGLRRGLDGDPVDGEAVAAEVGGVLGVPVDCGSVATDSGVAGEAGVGVGRGAVVEVVVIVEEAVVVDASVVTETSVVVEAVAVVVAPMFVEVCVVADTLAVDRLSDVARGC